VDREETLLLDCKASRGRFLVQTLALMNRQRILRRTLAALIAATNGRLRASLNIVVATCEADHCLDCRSFPGGCSRGEGQR